MSLTDNKTFAFMKNTVEGSKLAKLGTGLARAAIATNPALKTGLKMGKALLNTTNAVQQKAQEIQGKIDAVSSKASDIGAKIQDQVAAAAVTAKKPEDIVTKEVQSLANDLNSAVQEKMYLENQAPKQVEAEVKNIANVAVNNIKNNTWVEEKITFTDTQTAKQTLDTFKRFLKQYEYELEKVSRLMKDYKDPRQMAELAKYLRPENSEEEAPKVNLSDVKLGGGKYMSQLDRVRESLKYMMETLTDDNNAGFMDEATATAVRDNVKKLIIMSDRMDEKVQGMDFDAIFESQFEEQEATSYEIPAELINRYPPEVIEKARGIILILAFLKNVMDKFAKSPTSVAMCAAVAVLLIIANIMISIFFLINQIQKIAKGRLIKNPTNSQTHDFTVSKMGNLRSKYNLVFFAFIFINFAALALCCVGIFRIIRNQKIHYHRTPTLVKAILYAATCQAAIGFFGALVITIALIRKLRISSQRIASFNKLVYSNLYKNGTFLKGLRNAPSNSFSLINVVRDSLDKLPQNVTTEQLAQAMFTLNMYMHFQKLGYRNPQLYGALSHTFNVVGLLRKEFFSPADYLHRRTTFIKDNGDLMRDILIRLGEEKYGKNVTFMKKYNTTIDEAIIKSTELTAEANNLANTFFPEDALRIYLKLYIYAFITQTLPFIIALRVFRNKTLLKAFSVVLGVLTKKK